VRAKVEDLIFDEVQRQLLLNGFNARERQTIDASSSVLSASTTRLKNRMS